MFKEIYSLCQKGYVHDEELENVAVFDEGR
jgi:hypothetical protein